MSTILDEKIKEHFTKMCVFKGANKSIFASCSIPSYIRDWFLMRYEDKDGHIDEEFVSGRLYDIVPRREEWLHRLDRMMNYNEEQKFLAKIKVKLNLNTSEISFTLPDFDVNYKDTIIDREVWEKIKNDALAGEEEVWGVVTLAHVPYKKNTFKIELRNFALFRPYNINLEYYREARKNFTFEEWLKVLQTDYCDKYTGIKVPKGTVTYMRRPVVPTDDELEFQYEIKTTGSMFSGDFTQMENMLSDILYRMRQGKVRGSNGSFIKVGV